MRIFSSSESGVVMLDSVVGYQSLWSAINRFLASTDSSIQMFAKNDWQPNDFTGVLSGLEVVKAEQEIAVSINDSGFLRISGSSENLRLYLSPLDVVEGNEGGHRHLDQNFRTKIRAGSLPVVIEINSAQTHDLDSMKAGGA